MRSAGVTDPSWRAALLGVSCYRFVFGALHHAAALGRGGERDLCGCSGPALGWAPVLWPHAPGLAAEEAVESRLPVYPGRGHS